jgi:hypothetical protein
MDVHGCAKGVTEKIMRFVIWDLDHESESNYGYPVQQASFSWYWAHLVVHNLILVCVIAGFHCKVDENCTLLGCNAASGGNSLMTFQDNLLVPSSGVKNSLCNNPEEHSAHIFCLFVNFWTHNSESTVYFHHHVSPLTSGWAGWWENYLYVLCGLTSWDVAVRRTALKYIYTGSIKKMYTHFNKRKLYVVC